MRNLAGHGKNRLTRQHRWHSFRSPFDAGGGLFGRSPSQSRRCIVILVTKSGPLRTMKTGWSSRFWRGDRPLRTF